MSLKASDILGTSQVGVHLAMVGRVLFAPMQLTKKDVASLEDTLGLEVAQMSIGGSALVGALIAGNSNGIAVADIATEEDIDRLTSFGDVVVMESGVNAAGNLLVVNENGAVASPVLPEDGIEVLSETLKVDCVAIGIAGNDTPGSVLFAIIVAYWSILMSQKWKSKPSSLSWMFLPWWVLSISAHPTLVLDALQPTKVRGQVRKPRVLN